MRNNYNYTKAACYVGYITQAIMINLLPLLFVTFQETFQINIAKLTLITTIIFASQLIIDLLSTKLLDVIAYRKAAVCSQLFAVLGLILLCVLPYVMDPYAGILISIIIGSIGAGLTEVVISPIIEAMPGDKNPKAMNFLHSFYCWGSVFVVIVAVAYFTLFKNLEWRYLPLILAIVPLIGAVLFLIVPIRQLVEKKEEKMKIRELLTSWPFIIMLVMMFAAGAGELAVSQWASYFAEKGLNISKSMGDLVGPCLFAVLMGISRVVAGLFVDKVDQIKLLIICSCGLIVSYIIIFVSTIPIISLIGCALCGLFVGVMWPGNLNVAARTYKKGGTTMFALAALLGDLGCTAGPTMVGAITSSLGGGVDELKIGLIIAIVFPILMLIGSIVLKILFYNKNQKKI